MFSVEYALVAFIMLLLLSLPLVAVYFAFKGVFPSVSKREVVEHQALKANDRRKKVKRTPSYDEVRASYADHKEEESLEPWDWENQNKLLKKGKKLPLRAAAGLDNRFPAFYTSSTE